MVKTNLLYKMRCLCYIDFWKCLNWRLAPRLYRLSPEFEKGRLCMNWMLFFTAATFVVTTISTIYVVLSFYKKDKE